MMSLQLHLFSVQVSDGTCAQDEGPAISTPSTDHGTSTLGFNGCSNKESCQDGTGIATGNWGCGAFGGDPEIKSIIQWLAASQVLVAPLL